MGKHSRCVIGICDNHMRYPGIYRKHNNADGHIIMHKLTKDGAVRVTWINTILKGRKQVFPQSLLTIVTASLLG